MNNNLFTTSNLKPCARLDQYHFHYSTDRPYDAIARLIHCNSHTIHNLYILSPISSILLKVSHMTDLSSTFGAAMPFLSPLELGNSVRLLFQLASDPPITTSSHVRLSTRYRIQAGPRRRYLRLVDPQISTQHSL